MNAGTATARPEVPHPAPEGQHWVAEELPPARYRPAPEGRTCRYRGSRDPEACGRPAVVQERTGVTRITWWDHCADAAHNGGTWAEDGRVYRWKLVPQE